MIKAIICDDEKATFDIIKYFIKSENIPIVIVGTAENGKDGLSLINKKKPDLVFMDIQMPYLTGFEVIKNIGNIKTIIITAYGNFKYAQKALRLGVCDIITKPIDSEQLKGAINRAIGWNLTDNKDINNILNYIHMNFYQQITLSDLSKETFLSESHICRLFKKYMGFTVVAYIHKVRIEKAVSLFREKKSSIKETAIKVGYPDLNNFYKYFKIYMKDTPAAFIEKLNID